MRFKLVLLTSLLGAAVGASVSIVIITLDRHGLALATSGNRSNRLLVLLIYLPTIVVALLASIFVYRHTARQRKFQAALTGVLIIAFWLIALSTALFISH